MSSLNATWKASTAARESPGAGGRRAFSSLVIDGLAIVVDVLVGKGKV